MLTHPRWQQALCHCLCPSLSMRLSVYAHVYAPLPSPPRTLRVARNKVMRLRKLSDWARSPHVEEVIARCQPLLILLFHRIHFHAMRSYTMLAALVLLLLGTFASSARAGQVRVSPAATNSGMKGVSRAGLCMTRQKQRVRARVGVVCPAAASPLDWAHFPLCVLPDPPRLEQLTEKSILDPSARWVGTKGRPL